MPNALYAQDAAALTDPLVNAFLDAGIRPGEGTAGPDGYYTIFCGRRAPDLSRHPNIAVSCAGYTSTAAGAFQFLYSTWAALVRALGLTDFSVESQRVAAVELLRQNGALPYVQQGDWANAVARARGTWPSLPGGSQQQRTWAQWNAQMANAGAAAPPVATAPADPFPTITAPDAGLPIATNLQPIDDTTVIIVAGGLLVLFWLWWES